MRAIICVGISGSGKTTWAEKFCKNENTWKNETKWENINRDDIRRALFDFGPWGNYKFTKAREKRVTVVQEQLIFDAFIRKNNIIISDTNLNFKTRQRLISIFKKENYEIEIKEFDVPFEQAIKNDLKRLYPVGQQVMYKQWKQWKQYKNEKKHSHYSSCPSAVIVDVDGTVATMDNRGPFEWEKVGQDLPRYPVINLVRKYARDDYKIIILSGRDGCCEYETKDWLIKNGVPFDYFYMRKEGDSRNDSIIKREIFFEKIDGNFNVEVAIDDRPRVIREWYSIGIPLVLSIADPFIEF
jgi:predicted kinase